MSEVKELATIALRKRIWVWPDNLESDDANAGTFDKPLMSFQCAKWRAEQDDIIIIIPPHKQGIRERYLQGG